MPEVTLKINGRGYGLACEEGQEQRLTDLSHYVDSRLQDIAAAGAASNEAHLLVLTSLVLADEIYDLHEEVSLLQDQMRKMKSAAYTSTNANNAASSNVISKEEEQVIAGAIEHLADKIEQIAMRIHGAENTEAA